MTKIELISVPADYGHGANDKVYYPVGLLSVGTYLKKEIPNIELTIIDLHHQEQYVPKADIVGISATSVLNYKNVLAVAKLAKKNGCIVVLGGTYATQMWHQIIINRRGIIDFIINDDGEIPFAMLVKQILNGDDFDNIPNLVWKDIDGNVHQNLKLTKKWELEHFLPFNFSLLNAGIETYWLNYKTLIDSTVDAVFMVFTHFGCGYKNRKFSTKNNNGSLSNWCSYCALDIKNIHRKGKDIVEEIKWLIEHHNIPTGAKVMLKCYGDNIGFQYEMLLELDEEFKKCTFLSQYNIRWTFYMQSTFLSSKIASVLKSIGTDNLFIGFDSADEKVQMLNGMGTSLKNHKRAVKICSENDFRIQAAFVVGTAGETKRSLDTTLKFAKSLSKLKNLERINTSINVVIPGAPNYDLLLNKEPWIKNLDILEIKDLQILWIKHFCPDLGTSPNEGLDILNKYSNLLDNLCDGPHASMGYVSDNSKK